MIGVVAVLAVAALLAVDRRRAALAADAWPWLVAEIEGRVLRHGDPPAAAVAACLDGPPALAAVVSRVVAAQPADADGGTVLRAVAIATGDPRVERLGVAVALADARGPAATAVLRRLRERELAAVRARRARGAAVGAGAAARWLLLTPLAPVTADVLAAAWAAPVAVAAVAAWWAAGRWLSAAVDADRTGTWHR